MDPDAFDTLARTIAQSGTRRWLRRRLVAGLPLLGVLAATGTQESAAKRPVARLQRCT